MGEHLGASCITARTTVVHVLLSALVEALQVAGVGARLEGGDVEVCGSCSRAAAIQADDLFVCAGAGSEDLALAAGRGAAALLVDEAGAGALAAETGLPIVVVDDVRRAEAAMAGLFRAP